MRRVYSEELSKQSAWRAELLREYPFEGQDHVTMTYSRTLASAKLDAGYHTPDTVSERLHQQY